MAVTFGYSLGVRSDGAVVAWGGNVKGEGTVIPGTGGARVLAGFYDVVAVYSNTNADLAITSTGVVLGRGYGREWGAPITDITDFPKKLTHLGKAVAVAPLLGLDVRTARGRDCLVYGERRTLDYGCGGGQGTLCF